MSESYLAITGATGQLGRLVVTSLKERAPETSILALVRTPSKAADLGVETREFDYNANVETLAAALAGVKRLLLISSNEVGKRGAQHKNVIEAAKRAGVKRILYTSVLHADTSPLFVAPEHRETEAALKASGIPYTLLRNGWYTENYESGIQGALHTGALIGSAGEGKISSATRQDYAEAAVVALLENSDASHIYELAGDAGWTKSELAAELSRQTGRQIPYKDLPEAEFAAALQGAGLSPEWANAFAQVDRQTQDGVLYDDGKQLSQLIGRPTTPLSEAVAAIIGK